MAQNFKRNELAKRLEISHRRISYIFKLFEITKNETMKYPLPFFRWVKTSSVSRKNVNVVMRYDWAGII